MEASARSGARGSAETSRPDAGLLPTLKRATAQAHARIERDLPLLRPDFDLPAYVAHLGRLLGFYAPLEARLADALNGKRLPFGLAKRCKVKLLVRDLAALGVTRGALAALPVCSILPEVDNVPSCLGCLYVLEGATLGGRVVARHLATSLGVTESRGLAFFHGYGTETGAMWRELCDLLVDYDRRERSRRGRIVAAAEVTFDRFTHWLGSAEKRVHP